MWSDHFEENDRRILSQFRALWSHQFALGFALPHDLSKNRIIEKRMSIWRKIIRDGETAYSRLFLLDNAFRQWLEGKRISLDKDALGDQAAKNEMERKEAAEEELRKQQKREFELFEGGEFLFGCPLPLVELAQVLTKGSSWDEKKTDFYGYLTEKSESPKWEVKYDVLVKICSIIKIPPPFDSPEALKNAIPRGIKL